MDEIISAHIDGYNDSWYKKYMNYTYRIIIEKDDERYHGYVPALRGCHTFGTTIEETRINLKDAMETYLYSLIEDHQPIPTDDSLDSLQTITLQLKS